MRRLVGMSSHSDHLNAGVAPQRRADAVAIDTQIRDDQHSDEF
jgi:hypothetical protein